MPLQSFSSISFWTYFMYLLESSKTSTVWFMKELLICLFAAFKLQPIYHWSVSPVRDHYQREFGGLFWLLEGGLILFCCLFLDIWGFFPSTEHQYDRCLYSWQKWSCLSYRELVSVLLLQYQLIERSYSSPFLANFLTLASINPFLININIFIVWCKMRNLIKKFNFENLKSISKHFPAPYHLSSHCALVLQSFEIFYSLLLMRKEKLFIAYLLCHLKFRTRCRWGDVLFRYSTKGLGLWLSSQFLNSFFHPLPHIPFR